ncbi:MAG: filamentous hemagglutinin N-terminal domain-containing protein [Cyanobacteria bacterium P01_D01_bin.116]
MLRQSAVKANYSVFSKVIRLSIILSLHTWLGILALFGVNSAAAQIVQDASLGNETSKLIPNVDIKGLPAERIDGGATRGINLFHSFREFNIGDSQRVYFNNPAGIENILTRVTGGRVSNILGTLGVDGSANLFLINPSGIVFGDNARLDVGGSFVGSTADAVKFGEDRFFSASSPETPSELLRVKPSALLFNQIQPGRIENRSIASLEDNLFGLRVPDGRSLLLVGGDILMDGGWLNAPGGRVELAGIADNGTIGLNLDENNLILKVPDDLIRTDITIDNFGVVNVIGNNGGSIDINAKNIEIAGSGLYAGINLGLGSNESKIGDITLNAQQSTVIKASTIENFLYPGARGESGDIKITTNSLEVKDFSRIRNSTRGRGNTGQVLVEAQGEVSLTEGSTIFNRVLLDGIGNTGGVKIKANSFFLLEGAEIQTGNQNGVGNAGKVDIDVRDRIVFDGLYSDGFPSGIFTGISPQGIGNAGEINISANSFTLSDGARLQTKTEGQGNAGNVKINVGDRIILDGAKTNPNSNFEHLTGIFATLETDSFQSGGDVDIITGSLTIINGAEITANTFKLGNSGNITIKARQDINLDGFNNHGGRSGIFAAIGNPGDPGIGKGGNINIFADSLFLTNGAVIAASTSTGSQGNSGKITITTDKQVSLDGTGDEEASTGIFTAVQPGALGNANNIEIQTDLLNVTNGASLLTSTAGEGNAGNIKAEARILEVVDGGRFLTNTDGSGKAGNIILDVQDSIILSGSNTGLFANTTEGSTGDGGNIFIDPPRVTIRDGAKITVDSQGAGIGGNVELLAGFLTLDNGKITAETRSNTGGNINLNLQELLLFRNGSNISTTAGNEKFGGDGGNITINSPFVVALPQENSDITANAFSGSGGRVDIQTNGIFGIQSQPRLTENSDITASSDLGVDGEISIDNPDVNPSKGVEELPTNIVNAAGLIKQNLCTAARRGSEFVITGRGGLPASPHNIGDANSTWEDWSVTEKREISQPVRRNNQSGKKSELTTPIVEAQGWVVDNNGDIIFTAFPVKVTPKGTWLHPLDCQRLRKVS